MFKFLKLFKKNNRGETAAALTIISFILMAGGTLLGSYIAQKETRTLTKAGSEECAGKPRNYYIGIAKEKGIKEGCDCDTVNKWYVRWHKNCDCDPGSCPHYYTEVDTNCTSKIQCPFSSPAPTNPPPSGPGDGNGGACHPGINSDSNGCFGTDGCNGWEKCVNGVCFDTTNLGKNPDCDPTRCDHCGSPPTATPTPPGSASTPTATPTPTSASQLPDINGQVSVTLPSDGSGNKVKQIIVEVKKTNSNSVPIYRLRIKDLRHDGTQRDYSYKAVDGLETNTSYDVKVYPADDNGTPVADLNSHFSISQCPGQTNITDTTAICTLPNFGVANFIFSVPPATPKPNTIRGTVTVFFTEKNFTDISVDVTGEGEMTQSLQSPSILGTNVKKWMANEVNSGVPLPYSFHYEDPQNKYRISVNINHSSPNPPTFIAICKGISSENQTHCGNLQKGDTANFIINFSSSPPSVSSGTIKFEVNITANGTEYNRIIGWACTQNEKRCTTRDILIEDKNISKDALYRANIYDLFDDKTYDTFVHIWKKDGQDATKIYSGEERNAVKSVKPPGVVQFNISLSDATDTSKTSSLSYSYTAPNYEKVRSCYVRGDCSVLQVSNWVANNPYTPGTYSPGLKIQTCDPMLGQCNIPF